MSIVRLVDFLPLLQNNDITWNTVNASIWSILELDVGIIASSLATFRPFLRRVAPWAMGSSRDTPQDVDGFKPGSASYWTGGKDRNRRSKPHSFGLSAITATKNDEEDLNLGDGPKAEVFVSARDPAKRVSTDGSSDAAHTASTERIVQDPDNQGIVKTTHMHVRGADKAHEIGS